MGYIFVVTKVRKRVRRREEKRGDEGRARHSL